MGPGFQTFHKCMSPVFQYSHICMGPGFQTFQGPVFQRSHKYMGPEFHKCMDPEFQSSHKCMGPGLQTFHKCMSPVFQSSHICMGPGFQTFRVQCSKVPINVWPQGSRLSTNMWAKGSINVWAHHASYHCMVQHSTNEVARFCTQIQGAAACSSRLYRHIDLDYSVHNLNVCDTTFRLCMIILFSSHYQLPIVLLAVRCRS